MTGCIGAFHHSTDICAYTVAVKARKFLLLHGVKMVKFRKFRTHGARPILVTRAETSEILSRPCKGIWCNGPAIWYARGCWFQNWYVTKTWEKEVHNDVKNQAPASHASLFMCRTHVEGSKQGDHNLLPPDA